MDADLAEAQALLHRHAGTEAGSEPLADWLYMNWFHDHAPLRDFPTAGSYCAATARAAGFEPGWRLVALGPGYVDAEGPDGQRDRLAAGDFAPESPAAVPVSDAPLRRLRRTGAETGGFYHLWSDGWRAEPPEALVRIYLPLVRGAEVEAAALLVATAPCDSVWAAKFLCGVHAGGRRDPGLIYMPLGGERSAWVVPLIARLEPLLGGPPIRLARPFGGAWFAADPGGGRSYGQALCDLIAGAARLVADAAAFRAAIVAGLPQAARHLTEVAA